MVSMINPDAKSLQVLAHPMRGQILDILSHEGPATGAMLGERLDLRSGSVSWHLQKLAEHGFVELVPDRGDGRERWFRSVFQGIAYQYAEAMEAGPEEAASVTAYSKSLMSVALVGATRFFDEDWSFEWRHATIFDNYDLILDPPALERFRDEFWSLGERYRVDPSTTADALHVTVTAQAYPRTAAAST
jgi:DNA-binding transcriptional ArsR family regulator